MNTDSQWSSTRHVRTSAALASVGILVSLVLSALPQEPITLPFVSGHQEDALRADAATGAAVDVFRQLERASLPVENPVVYAHGSKLSFEDRRIVRTTVARTAPGRVHFGGVIEVFPDPDRARSRAKRLSISASHSLGHVEYTYLHGRVLLRVSPYLSDNAADRYAAVIHATAFARPRDGTAHFGGVRQLG